MRSLALLLALAACGGSKGPARPAAAPAPAPAPVATTSGPDLEAELARIEELTSRACACPDAACLEEADRAFAAYVDVATIDNPVTGIQAWPDDLNARGKVAFEEMQACFEAQGVPQRHAPARYMVRRVELYAEHGCDCPDDACREVTLASFQGFHAWATMMTFADDHALAARVRGGLNSLARCLTPVLEDEIDAGRTLFGTFRDRVCGCADLACAKPVVGEMSAWIEQDLSLAMVVMTDARLLATIEAMNVCLHALGVPKPRP